MGKVRKQISIERLEELAKLIRYYILTSTTEAGSGHPTSSQSAVELMVSLMFGGVFRFDLDDVNMSAARFDREKLAWINQQYIMKHPAGELVLMLSAQYQRLDISTDNGPPLSAVVEVFRERAVTMEDLASSTTYLYRDFRSEEHTSELQSH